MTNATTSEPTMTPEQVAQLDSTCPEWCERRPHDWHTEAEWGWNCWQHSKTFSAGGQEVVQVSAFTDHHGLLVKIELLPTDWDGVYAIDTHQVAEELHDIGNAYISASAFVRAEVDRMATS